MSKNKGKEQMMKYLTEPQRKLPLSIGTYRRQLILAHINLCKRIGLKYSIRDLLKQDRVQLAKNNKEIRKDMSSLAYTLPRRERKILDCVGKLKRLYILCYINRCNNLDKKYDINRIVKLKISDITRLSQKLRR